MEVNIKIRLEKRKRILLISFISFLVCGGACAVIYYCHKIPRYRQMEEHALYAFTPESDGWEKASAEQKLSGAHISKDTFSSFEAHALFQVILDYPCWNELMTMLSLDSGLTDPDGEKYNILYRYCDAFAVLIDKEEGAALLCREYTDFLSEMKSHDALRRKARSYGEWFVADTGFLEACIRSTAVMSRLSNEQKQQFYKAAELFHR